MQNACMRFRKPCHFYLYLTSKTSLYNKFGLKYIAV